MGVILEVQKLILASWLFHNWKKSPVLLKSYLTIALLVLMCLTSMGIYGYLTKAHVEQGNPTSFIATNIEYLEDQIQYHESILQSSKGQLGILDEQIKRFTDLGAVTKGIEARKAQKVEREELLAAIAEAQENIQALRKEVHKNSVEVQKVEVKVGPLRYIAEAIFGEDEASLEKAVRWFIIFIVMVFDPLAIMMVIAANWSLAQNKIEQAAPVVAEAKPEPAPAPAPSRQERKEKHSKKSNSWITLN